MSVRLRSILLSELVNKMIAPPGAPFAAVTVDSFRILFTLFAKNSIPIPDVVLTSKSVKVLKLLPLR